MRFATCITENGYRWGVVASADDLLLVPTDGPFPASLAALIEQGPDAARDAGQRLYDGAGERMPRASVRLAAPIPQPRRNVICLGLNYRAHAEESMKAKGREVRLPEHPVVFTKAPGTVSGPYDDVVLDPRVTTQADWEVELAVVLGRRLQHASAAEAQRAIFGYTVVNDLTARDLQFRHKQFFLGKSVDGFCPMGPWIVTADAINDPQSLALTCRVNEETMQSGNTSDQIFGVVDTLVRLSSVMTLEPGDILATGTPEGVGFARQPPRFLAPGDVVECEIEGVGRIRNSLVAPKNTQSGER